MKRIVVVAGYRAEDVKATVRDHHLPVEMVVNDVLGEGHVDIGRGRHPADRGRSLWSSWETTCSRRTTYGS